MEQGVPKRRNIKFWRRGITQKKTYNVQNKVKVWNQEYLGSFFLDPEDINTLRTGDADLRF